MSFHKGIIPREGFHADVVGDIISRTALNPLVTLPIALLARFTSKGAEVAGRYPRAALAARLLVILGILKSINARLSRRAVNNGLTDKFVWHKEVVVVTGGSDGIGKQIVLMLAKKNFKVAVLDIQPLTYKAPSSVKFFSCDITSTESLSNAANEIRTTLGAPTVLVNNAGVCRGKALLDNTDADLNLTFNVNAISHYKIVREFLPEMIQKNHGMVVTVASSAAFVTAPRMTEYAATKAAAQSFHEGLAAELVATYKAPRIRTVLVNQGYTQTSLFQGFGVKKTQFLAPALEVDTVAQAIVDQIILGESGQIILPGAYKLMAVHMRSLPDWLTYPARAGMGNLMKNWRGRQVDVPAAGKAAPAPKA